MRRLHGKLQRHLPQEEGRMEETGELLGRCDSVELRREGYRCFHSEDQGDEEEGSGSHTQREWDRTQRKRDL